MVGRKGRRVWVERAASGFFDYGWRRSAPTFAQNDGAFEGRASGFGDHVEGVLGAEGDFGLGFWGVGVGVAEAEVLGEGGYGEDAFHPGEGLADTLAAAAAEGEVGVFWAGGFGFGGEAVGVEAEGVGVVGFGAGDDVLGEEEVGSRGKAVGAEGDGAGVHAAHGPGGGVEAHGFGEDLLGVAEGGVVGQRRESTSQV